MRTFIGFNFTSVHDLLVPGWRTFDNKVFGCVGRPSNNSHSLASLADISADWETTKNVDLNFLLRICTRQDCRRRDLSVWSQHAVRICRACLSLELRPKENQLTVDPAIHSPRLDQPRHFCAIEENHGNPQS